MTSPSKEFQMRRVVENVLDLKVDEEHVMKEEHFGGSWSLVYSRTRNSFLSILVKCDDSHVKIRKWSIEAEVEIKIIAENKKCISATETCLVGNTTEEELFWGWHRFLDWNNLYFYAVDGKVTIEARVKILKMSGLGREKLKIFDESMKAFSDVVLIVEEKEKFHVSKLFLSAHSSYFNSLLIGGFAESQQSEIVLKDVNSEDFQNFLELIHGENSTDDYTVTGILHLADMYDAPTAIRRCEEFLLKESKKSMKDKLKLSIRYKLNGLKTKCLSDIKSIAEIRSIFPGNISDLDPSLTSALLQKALDFK